MSCFIFDFEFMLSEAALATAFENANDYGVEDVEYSEVQPEELDKKLIESDGQKQQP